MTYNITLTANHQSLTAKYLPLAAESVQYLTAKVVYETDDWTGREIKAMFGRGCTVYEVPVIDGEITAKQQLNLTAGDWRVWLVGNSARDGDVIPRITTNVAHIRVAPTGSTEGNPFPAIPPTVEEQLRADMGDLADLTTEDKSSLVAAINEVRQTGGGGVQPDWNQNDSTQPDYIKNRPFYTGDPVETVLVPESTVSFAENQGLYVAQFPSTFEATVGETYKVYWDGAAYECACVNFNGTPAIGNLSIAGEGSDTGEPFVMVVYNGRGIIIGTADTSASHTVSISAVVSVVKIDEKYLPNTVATKSEVEVAQNTARNAQTTANDAQTTANNAQTTANNAQATANAALPKTGGTMSGNLTIDTENDSYQTIISPGKMALQYVRSTGSVDDMLVISGRNIPHIVAGEGSPTVFKLSEDGLSLGCTSKDKDGIHLYHSNRSSSPGEIVIQHTNLNNYAKERISIASTGEIECNNRLKFNCGSEIEVVQTYGKTGGSAIILWSSTPNSTKKFKITVDDNGTISATEVS